MYDYREAVKDDVLEYINNEINFEDFDTLEELEEHLNEVLFTEDSVTGNASGSYTFNTYEAEENICYDEMASPMRESCSRTKHGTGLYDPH